MKEVPPIKKLEEKQLKKVFTKRGWIITKTKKFHYQKIDSGYFYENAQVKSEYGCMW